MDLKQLYCKHNYKKIAMFDNKEPCVNVTYYQCTKCKKKRAVIHNGICLKEYYLEQVEMWKKNQYELTESDVHWIDRSPQISFLERCYKL